MSVTEIKYKSGRVLRIIDGEYIIGAGGSCNNKVLCPKKIFNGYVVRRCGSDDELDCSGGCIYDEEFYSNDDEIYLNDRNLNELDKCICCYKSLDTLEANNNNLANIPDSICNMEYLLDLCLNNNQLTTLPECIGNLDKPWVHIYLENNNFTDEYKDHIKNDLFPIANENGHLYL